MHLIDVSDCRRVLHCNAGSIPWQLKLLLGLVMVISAIYTVLYHGLLLLPWSCVALKINTKNQLQLLRKDGRQLEVTVNDNSVVTPYLTILNSRIKEASLLQRIFVQHLIILPDAVDAEAYRQLRVATLGLFAPTALIFHHASSVYKQALQCSAL